MSIQPKKRMKGCGDGAVTEKMAVAIFCCYQYRKVRRSQEVVLSHHGGIRAVRTTYTPAFMTGSRRNAEFLPLGACSKRSSVAPVLAGLLMPVRVA